MTKGAVPHHIAVIPDGNRRWAKRHAFSALLGHRRGADNLRAIVQRCAELGVGYVTVYSFSTENWRRPPAEIDAVFEVIAEYCLRQSDMLVTEGIRLATIGDLAPLPAPLLKVLDDTRRATARGTKMELTLALNYGGHSDLCEAAKKLAASVSSGQIALGEVDEAQLRRQLNSGGLPPVDLLIRAGGERRLSNFLLWQMAYAELYFCDLMWPEFSTEELQGAINWFAQRTRRYGS